MTTSTNMGSLGLFTGVPQYKNFASLHLTQSVSLMPPAAIPCELPTGQSIALPETYAVDGTTRSLQSLIDDTHTSALLVLKEGVLRFEQYFLTGGRRVPWLSMSVAKSFVSALVGIATEEKFIESLETPIDRYVPLLAGSAYGGVRIKDVLQMSSGARWNEDYSDPDSDILRMGSALGPGGSVDVFMAEMVRESAPGTICRYNSADTQALGMLIAGATGRTLTDYMHEKLVVPLGMESPSYWVLDSKGREMAFAGVLMTARDFARLGELYRQRGVWGGRQIVSAAYVDASVRVESPHLAPGLPLVGDHAFPMGYGYQWWLPPGQDGEFSAIGVYNQYVYVDPSRGVVIVKLSANPAYGTSKEESVNKDYENILAMRSISRQFA